MYFYCLWISLKKPRNLEQIVKININISELWTTAWANARWCFWNIISVIAYDGILPTPTALNHILKSGGWGSVGLVVVYWRAALCGNWTCKLRILVMVKSRTIKSRFKTTSHRFKIIIIVTATVFFLPAPVVHLSLFKCCGSLMHHEDNRKENCLNCWNVRTLGLSSCHRDRLTTYEC